MAAADPLPDADRRSVAGQIGQFLAAPRGVLAAAGFAPAPRAELTESLAVCVLPASAVTDPPADLLPLARPSGQWHHQVRTAGGPTHAARSVEQGFAAGGLEVNQVGPQPLAAKIDAAVTWVDANVPDDAATVRLLVAPAYYVHALLIVRGDLLSAVLVSQPDSFKRLDYEREYPFRDFLKRLAGERPGGTFAG